MRSTLTAISMPTLYCVGSNCRAISPQRVNVIEAPEESASVMFRFFSSCPVLDWIAATSSTLMITPRTSFQMSERRARARRKHAAENVPTN
jgi:hypothetical protein